MFHLFINLFIVLIAFNVIIFAHESAHLLFARLFGVAVLEVSIGLGRVLYSWHVLGIQLNFKLWPIGGYVRFLDQETIAAGPMRTGVAFEAIAVWKQGVIVVAGAWMNFILACFIFFVVFKIGFYFPKSMVDMTRPQSPAFLADVQRDSEIISVSGQRTPTVFHVQLGLLAALGEKESLEMVFAENHQSVKRKLIIRDWQLSMLEPYLLKHIGIELKTPRDLHDYQFIHANGFEAVRMAFNESLFWCQFQLLTLKKLVTGKISLGHLSGPMSFFSSLTLTITHQLILFVYLMGALSAVLALLNLMPIPGLDGGHLCYILFALVRGRAVSKSVQVLLMRLFMILFLVVFLQITLIDMLRFIATK